MRSSFEEGLQSVFGGDVETANARRKDAEREAAKELHKLFRDITWLLHSSLGFRRASGGGREGGMEERGGRREER